MERAAARTLAGGIIGTVAAAVLALPALTNTLATIRQLPDEIEELELATLSWVHWYNENRLHSAIDYLTPTEYEQAYYRDNTPRKHPLPGEPALH